MTDFWKADEFLEMLRRMGNRIDPTEDFREEDDLIHVFRYIAKKAPVQDWIELEESCREQESGRPSEIWQLAFLMSVIAKELEENPESSGSEIQKVLDYIAKQTHDAFAAYQVKTDTLWYVHRNCRNAFHFERCKIVTLDSKRIAPILVTDGAIRTIRCWCCGYIAWLQEDSTNLQSMQITRAVAEIQRNAASEVGVDYNQESRFYRRLTPAFDPVGKHASACLANITIGFAIAHEIAHVYDDPSERLLRRELQADCHAVALCRMSADMPGIWKDNADLVVAACVLAAAIATLTSGSERLARDCNGKIVFDENAYPPLEMRLNQIQFWCSLWFGMTPAIVDRVDSVLGYAEEVCSHLNNGNEEEGRIWMSPFAWKLGTRFGNPKPPAEIWRESIRRGVRDRPN